MRRSGVVATAFHACEAASGNTLQNNPFNPGGNDLATSVANSPWGTPLTTSPFNKGNFSSPADPGTYGSMGIPQGAPNPGSYGNFGNNNVNQGGNWWDNISPTGVDWNSSPNYFSGAGRDFSGQNYWGPGFNQTTGPGYDPWNTGFSNGEAGGSFFGSQGNGNGVGNPMSGFDQNINAGGNSFGWDPNSAGAGWGGQNAWGTQGGSYSFQQPSVNSGFDPYSAGGNGAGWGTSGDFGNFGQGASSFNDYGNPFSGGSNGAFGQGQGWNQGPGWDSSGFGGNDSGGLSNFDSSGFGDYGGGGYAKGGPIQGRRVPPQASPSRGARTDDVKANLNVGEFVMPKDVTQWYGQKFFQDLINKSRKARMTAPGGGQPSPSLPGPTRFNSAG